MIRERVTRIPRDMESIRKWFYRPKVSLSNSPISIYHKEQIKLLFHRSNFLHGAIHMVLVLLPGYDFQETTCLQKIPLVITHRYKLISSQTPCSIARTRNCSYFYLSDLLTSAIFEPRRSPKKFCFNVTNFQRVLVVLSLFENIGGDRRLRRLTRTSD